LKRCETLFRLSSKGLLHCTVTKGSQHKVWQNMARHALHG
jgi:hypothetical protein